MRCSTENEIIEFCNSKNIEERTTDKIVNYYRRVKDDSNILSNLMFMYDIFSYIGCDSDKISKILYCNTAVLKWSEIEIIKFAYVFNSIEFDDDIYENERLLALTKYYKRMFMRNLVNERSNKIHSGYNYLLSGGCTRVYDENHRFSLTAYRLFKVHVSNDDELEKVLDNILTLNGQNITVDDYLRKSALSFFIKYKESRKQKDGKKSI